MTLQAYIDDSWDDGGTYVLAGYIATAEQWAAFSAEWEALLPLATKNKEGKYRFKMSEMARYGKMDIVPLFYNTIMKHVQMSISCVIDRNELKTKVDNLVGEVVDPAWGNVAIDLEPFKRQWRKPFFFSFRALMDTFHQEMASNNRELIPVDGVVDFIFDQDDNERYISRIWDEYVSKREPEHQRFFGRKPQFGKDEDFPALQAADFRAWWVRRWANEFGQRRVSEGNYPFDTDGNKIRHLILDVGDLDFQRMIAETIGNGVYAAITGGGRLTPSDASSVRFWPRKPL